MTDTSPTEYIRILVNDQMRDIDRALAENRFADVDSVLEKTNAMVQGMPDLAQLVHKKAAYVADVRESRLAELLAESRQLLSNEQGFDEGRIGVLLDKAEAIAPRRAEVMALREDLAHKGPRLREQRLYEKMRRQCRALWEDEQRLVQANVPTNEILEGCFYAAVQIAQQALNDYSKSKLLQGLLSEAQREYDSARTRYEVKSTADETGDYKSLIEELRKEKDPDKLIPWRDATGAPREPISVASAMREAELLAADFAYRKGNEYLRQAQEHMAAHAPRAAKETLDQRRSLYLLPDDIRQLIEGYLEQAVEPALVQLADAEKRLHQAEKADDPDRGWKFIEEAVALYPWVPGVDDVRQALLPRLMRRAEQRLQAGERYLKNNELPDALPAGKEAHRLVTLVTQYADQYELASLQEQGQLMAQQTQSFIDRCQVEEKLRAELNEAADRIEQSLRTNPATALRQWQGLVEEHGEETIERFPRLRRLRREVETHSGISSLLTRLDSVFTSNDEQRIRNALPDIEQVLDKPENADFKEQLLAMQDKLRLRADYLAALTLLHENGDVEAALPLLDRVAQRPKHPDSASAGAEAGRIRDNIDLANRVGKALREARQLMDKNPQNPRRAYEVLAPLADAPSLRRGEIQEQLTLARMAWAQRVEARVEQELAKSKPRAEQLRKLVAEIRQELPEPRPVEVAERAAAKAAAVEAELYQDGHKWEDAVKKWQEALAHDHLNPDYRLRWQEARKRVAEIELSRVQGDEEARGLFADLEEVFPLDPEIREMRVRYYLRQAEMSATNIARQIDAYAAAREALNAANVIVTRPGLETDQALTGRLRDLESVISRGEQLSRKQAAIERKLQPGGSLTEFDKARREAFQLIADHPESTSLVDWWQRTSQRIISTLEAQIADLPGDELWQRFDLQSKILALNTEHALAQQLLRRLPVLGTDINQEIDRLLQDSKSGLLVTVRDDMVVIEAQEQLANQKREQARAIYDMFQGFRDHIRDPTVGPLLLILQENLARLQGFIEELGTLRQLKAQALSYLSQARLNGDWRNFEQVLQQFNRDGYNTHRTVEALRQERNRVQQRRAELLALREDLVRAIESEHFAEAQRLMNLFETDNELGDPHDDYGLRATIEVADPLTGSKVKNWRQLRNWLQERQDQIVEVSRWLVRAGGHTVIARYGLALPAMKDMPQGVVSWKQTEGAVNGAVGTGRFGEAKERVVRMLEGDQNWYDFRMRLLAVYPAVRILEQPPFTLDQALSRRAQELLKDGLTYRQNWLLLQAELGKKAMVWISEQQKGWEIAFPQLGQVFSELEALYAKGWWWRRRNPEEIEQVAVRVRAALMQCKAIAAEHPSLQGIEDHPLLVRGG